MHMRSRLGGVALAAVSIGSLLAVAAPAALADTRGAPKVLQSNWYWYHQADAADGTGLEVLPEPSGVPKNDLSVAYTGGTTTDATQPSKETYLAFDLSGIDRTATVTAFTFTLTLDGLAQLKTTPPVLIACAPVRNWNNGAATPWAQKPTDDCSPAIAATGVVDSKAGTYTFAIPSMAQSWLGDVNTGVAIRQDPAKQKVPFQLNFTSASTVKASLTYAPPVSTPSTPTTPAYTAPPPAATTNTPSGSLGGTGTTSNLGVPSVAAPTVATPTAPAPQLAPQQAPAAAIAHIKPAGSMPSTGFWLIAAAVLVCLVLVSRTLGGTQPPPPTTTAHTSRRGSRLDHVLRSRRTSFTLEPR
jgi:hypothetical protein